MHCIGDTNNPTRRQYREAISSKLYRSYAHRNELCIGIEIHARITLTMTYLCTILIRYLCACFLITKPTEKSFHPMHTFKVLS